MAWTKEQLGKHLTKVDKAEYNAIVTFQKLPYGELLTLKNGRIVMKIKNIGDKILCSDPQTGFKMKIKISSFQLPEIFKQMFL